VTSDRPSTWKTVGQHPRRAELAVVAGALVALVLLVWALSTGLIAGLGKEDPACPQSLRDSYAEAGEWPPQACR
jgi:hypothetical protein